MTNKEENAYCIFLNNGVIKAESASDWERISCERKRASDFRRRGMEEQGMPQELGEFTFRSIKEGLSAKVIGQRIVCLDVTDSTNTQAKRLGREGTSEGTVVLAEMQTGGRGRLERSFFSPRGKGLWFSVLLRPSFPPAEAPKCTLLAAVAVAMAMERFGLRAGIKWPNDILHDGKKLTGILTEMSVSAGKIDFVVIGIGINVNIAEEEFPAELREIATSLSVMKGEEISRIAFLQAVLEEIEVLYLRMQREGFAPILKQWKKYSATLGKEVRVIGMGDRESFCGTAVDLDEDGMLLVRTGEGIRKVLAGDVSIRPQNE